MAAAVEIRGGAGGRERSWAQNGSAATVAVCTVFYFVHNFGSVFFAQLGVSLSVRRSREVRASRPTQPHECPMVDGTLVQTTSFHSIPPRAFQNATGGFIPRVEVGSPLQNLPFRPLDYEGQQQGSEGKHAL